MSLLNKAKKFTLQRVKGLKPVTEEELDLVFAFLEREITLYQIGCALNFSDNYCSNVWGWICTRLRRAVINGQIKIVKTEMEK